MLAYRVSMNAARPPSYWPRESIDEIGLRHGDHLVGFADTFASRPGNPVAATLSCDLSVLHHNRAGSWTAKPRTVTGPAPIAAPPPPPPPQPNISSLSTPPPPKPKEIQQQQRIVGTVSAEARDLPPVSPALAYVNDGGVYIDPRAVGRRPSDHGSSRVQGGVPPMEPSEFSAVLSRLVREITVNVGGSPT